MQHRLFSDTLANTKWSWFIWCNGCSSLFHQQRAAGVHAFYTLYLSLKESFTGLYPLHFPIFFVTLPFFSSVVSLSLTFHSLPPVSIVCFLLISSSSLFLGCSVFFHLCTALLWCAHLSCICCFHVPSLPIHRMRQSHWRPQELTFCYVKPSTNCEARNWPYHKNIQVIFLVCVRVYNRFMNI